MRCSLCDKPREKVRRLVEGPTGGTVCDECVNHCARELLAADGGPRCSFCGKSREQVRKLFAPDRGNSHTLICDECVDLCADLLGDHRAAEAHDPPTDGAVLDPVAWYRRVLHEGRGRTVMTCNGPGRHIGFAVYDEPDSPEGRVFWTPLHAAKTELPEHVLNAVRTPQARMALCHLISVGGAPPL